MSVQQQFANLNIVRVAGLACLMVCLLAAVPVV